MLAELGGYERELGVLHAALVTGSLALLACAEQRPRIFLSEYLETARHVLHSSMAPRHAIHYPVSDRLRQVKGAVGLAGAKVGVVAQVAWAQVRPARGFTGWS